MNYYKAYIRVVKQLTEYNFGSENILVEKLIIAEDKADVKRQLIEKYPQFFPDNKIYEKSTKDEAQFFYVLIYELDTYEIKQVENSTIWKCEFCGKIHENTYLSPPFKKDNWFDGKLFCKTVENYCFNEYIKLKNSNNDLLDDPRYVKSDSPIFIYKITEKTSGKSYIGKTKNAPFFRWWNHLQYSHSPFGIYLRNETKLSDWVFEVLEELPSFMNDSDILKKESEYIIKYDSIKNGFNTVISNKSTLIQNKIENE